MTAFDRRLTPARADLAASFLRGKVEAARFVDGEPRRVAVPVAALRPRPAADAGIDTELLLGETVQVYDIRDGFAFIQADADGYVGHVAESALAPMGAPATHRVTALRTFVYSGPGIKFANPVPIAFGSLLSVIDRSGDFAVTDSGGHVFAAHVAPLDTVSVDPAAVAEMFLHCPYLWGGRSSLGLDCSGLLQTALRAAGHAAPRDSDMLEGWCANPLPLALDKRLLRRGDMIFWKGHCGLMLDAARLIHANGHHMTVAIEPLAVAEERILRKSFGPITSMARLPAA
jgi:cell wall-associated NlpC family hydrolase